jgi:hypothetical protein
MNKPSLKTSVGWGFLLWFIGYIFGIILFPFVPVSKVGWIIMPIGITLTLWVLIKRIKTQSFRDYFTLSIVWTLIAIVFDYFFLVKLFKPADGYYKLDVYLYYLLTFALPLIVGFQKTQIKVLSHSN